jgi:hypothetical protein
MFCPHCAWKFHDKREYRRQSFGFVHSRSHSAYPSSQLRQEPPVYCTQRVPILTVASQNRQSVADRQRVAMLRNCFCVQDDCDDSDRGLIMRDTFLTDPEPTTTNDSSTFFRDGHRKIDFVLVYEENSRRPTALDTSGDRKTNKLDTWRQRFMANLRREGLDMEEVCNELWFSINQELIPAEVLTAMNIKSMMLWAVTPYILVDRYQRCRRMYWLCFTSAGCRVNLYTTTKCHIPQYCILNGNVSCLCCGSC